MFRAADDPIGEREIDALVGLMRSRAGTSNSNPRIAAGYTYIGQFVDHDITFDATSSTGREIDPDALTNFRTPRLDLDSVYGSGRRVHPFLYDWDREPEGGRMLIDHRPEGHMDLPRNSRGRALIGDARNDENALVAQVHLLFLRFHNAVVNRLMADGCEPDKVFRRARRLVRWHYQWLVVHDFLRTVVGKETLRRVLVEGDPPEVRLRWFKQRERSYIPVEFSVAAFRFGHSMIRRDYRVQCPAQGRERPPLLKLFDDLNGLRELDAKAVVDWERFFDLGGEAQCQLQLSLEIDTSLAPPLFELPDDGGELPRLNLQRSSKLRVPSGQTVARRMRKPALEPEELLLEGLPPRMRSTLSRNTPLWYYILAETIRVRDEDLPDRPLRDGSRLGEIGGRIVAEVLVGLLAWDPTSYLYMEPGWEPTYGTDGDFTAADLVRFVREFGD